MPGESHPPAAKSWRCRVFDHRWTFLVQGSDLIWGCERCGHLGGRRSYAEPREARRFAAAFNKGKPKPPGVFLAVFGGLHPDRGAHDGGQREDARGTAAGRPGQTPD